MKALALDSANTKIYIAAKNENKTVTTVFDIGMKQSETILPAIAYTLEQVKLTAAELDYTVLCKGPGSFTGLRLGFAALKALELANGTPTYAVMTLHSYAFPFKDFPQTVLSVIDAKKEKFYAAAYRNGKIFIPADDYEIKDLLEKLKDCGELLICGPDRFSFKEILKKEMPECPVFCTEFDIPSTDSLFAIAEEMRLKNAAPLADYDGPEYMRASEAEENLNR